MCHKVCWCRRGLWAAACVLGVLAVPALGVPYFRIHSTQDWYDALQGDPPHVRALSDWEGYDYLNQWALYLQEGEPYPPTQFLMADLYVFWGGGPPPWPEDTGLVMLWGSGVQLPPGDYASAWGYDYLEDPDLSTAVITTIIFAPQFGPQGQINQVSLGIRDILGRTRSWYWNCGPGQPIPWNTPTAVTIYVSGTGLSAASPPASGYMSMPGFDSRNAQFLIADENAVFFGGELPVPPPGAPYDGLWNLWHEIEVRPQWELTKWYQPPDPAEPNDVYYGWDETSLVFDGALIAADDWVANGQPVTAVRWWGSFYDWHNPYPPPQTELPYHFHISFWTDVPPGGTNDFSHPGQMLHLVGPPHEWNYTCQFVGWEYDPRTKEYEACFEFQTVFEPQEWFYPPADGIYWTSISACYNCAPPTTPHVFGWLTRPRDLTSPAPDDGVVMYTPVIPWPGSWYVSGWPIEFPDGVSWDLAFELLTTSIEPVTKWVQGPDLTSNGIDVNACGNPSMPGPPYVLANDFLCSVKGPLTDMYVWGSWLGDYLPFGNDPAAVRFTLSIHADIPASQSPTGYSMPGDLLWLRTFEPGEFTEGIWAEGIEEGWLNPPWDYFFPADWTCWMYHFHIDPLQAFVQQGSPYSPIVYWLDVHAEPLDPQAYFGWKTAEYVWNDDAVWAYGPEPVTGPWNELIHFTGVSLDLAFSLLGWSQSEPYPIWSQPPQPYVPENAFNGWDQSSMYSFQIAADDWVCNTDNPVTDVHWWGSFIGWYHPYEPPQGLPPAFHIAIWTDVPADPTDPTSFSHPGQVIHEIICDNFEWDFVGWDFDPREIGDQPSMPPEATFKFTQYLDPSEWFWQQPGGNIYWISIAAMYPAGQVVDYPWGWKTRPQGDVSPATDDAVWISDPAAPTVGDMWVTGGPLFYPTPEYSWDLAFELTSQPRDLVVCEPQGAVNNPFHPPTYWYDVTPDDFGRCDFHVQVFDPNPMNYTNIVAPPGWWFMVHPVAPNEWWASWWDPNECDNAIFNTFRFQFDHQGSSTWGDWSTTIGNTPDPYNWVVDCSQNHAHQPDGWGYHVHVPLPPPPRDAVVCEPQGPPGNPMHPPTYWYDVLVGGGYGRCDFHVQVYDPNPANYVNVVTPPTWVFAVHQLPNGERWASWWDPDCSNPILPGMVFRFQFDNPNASTWSGWTTTESSSSDPYAGIVDWWLNHTTEPDGYGYRVHVPRPGVYPKWEQPPVENPDGSGYIYGWNEMSIWFGPQYVADDFKCCDARPISDIHWWGSYLNWLEMFPPPPPIAPCCFQLGLWTDVPAGPDNPFSHPGVMIREWWVMREALNEHMVGVDFHPEHGYETCFRYDFFIPEPDWYYQPDTQEVFWLSIAAMYDFQPPMLYEWGWKTRPHFWNDDAVRIFAPLQPVPGVQYGQGEPIVNSEGGWDMAFVLTTPIAPPGICRGDLSGDGLVDFGDINPFVLRLSNAQMYHEYYPCVPDENGDINADGAVDFGDINPFVACLCNHPLPIVCGVHDCTPP